MCLCTREYARSQNCFHTAVHLHTLEPLSSLVVDCLSLHVRVPLTARVRGSVAKDLCVCEWIRINEPTS